MPPLRPASLPDDQYAEIIAYILQVNGLVAGDADLPRDLTTLGGMIIGRDGL